MRKLELKDIVRHLLYDLKCRYNDEDIILTLDPLAIETDVENRKLPIWHFDYKNLIEDGLAIDINTINL